MFRMMITPDPNLKGRCVRIPIYMDEEEVWVEYRSFNPEKQLVEVDLSSYPIPRASSKKYGGWTSLCVTVVVVVVLKESLDKSAIYSGTI